MSSDNVKERSYFKKFLENPKYNSLIISEPVISKTMGIWVMTLNRPIFNKKHQPIGLICVTVSLEKLKDTFSRLELGKGTVVLYNWDGVFYTSFPFNESKVGKVIKKRTRYNLYKNLNQHFVHLDEMSPVENKQRLYTFRRFTQHSQYPFSIGIGYDKKEILNEWLKRSIFQFGIFILLSIGLWINLVRYLISQDRLRDQRRQNLQNSKLSSLGEMASGIAHEINNPLMVILGTANSVQKLKERGEFKEDKVDLYMKKIIENTYRITKIISGLKNFSRDSFDDEFKPAKLENLFINTKDLCHSRIMDKNIDLQIELSEKIDLNCREVQLVQVFVILVNNSIDALGDNPEKKKWIKIEAEVVDNTIYIKFIDNGMGITQEIAEKIMNPFFTTKEVGKGTGLGLSISKGIIEDHGGKFYLDLNSEFTTFVIELPKK